MFDVVEVSPVREKNDRLRFLPTLFHLACVCVCLFCKPVGVIHTAQLTSRRTLALCVVSYSLIDRIYPGIKREDTAVTAAREGEPGYRLCRREARPDAPGSHDANGQRSHQGKQNKDGHWCHYF